MHAPLYRRLLARLSHRTRHRTERAVLGVLSAAVLAGGSAALARADILADPSPFLAPVLALGAAVLVLGAAKLFLLYVKRDHAPERLRAGLAWFLCLRRVVAIEWAEATLYEPDRERRT